MQCRGEGHKVIKLDGLKTEYDQHEIAEIDSTRPEKHGVVILDGIYLTRELRP